MKKTFVGSRLRQLRRSRGETQAQMAEALGISASYVNLLENNQRSLSVTMLMALSDAYKVDWRDLIRDQSANLLHDVRNMFQDPVFGDDLPDLQEMRSAIDHAPKLVDCLLDLHKRHRRTMDRIVKGGSASSVQELVASSAEAITHDFFKKHRNYVDLLEQAAERARSREDRDADEVYSSLKQRLRREHNIKVETCSIDEMGETLRDYDKSRAVIRLSEVLDHQNRIFQLAHVLGLVEFADILEKLKAESGISSEQGLARCHVELANYFAASYLMPYERFLESAERTAYDIDRLAGIFGVSFEQVAHRLTTMQRPGARGVPFFFLRVDKAGNVTKRFNATSFNLAEHGGSCPVWNIHTVFRTPGTIRSQFVEMPDGERFFTIARTSDRPVFSRQSQDRRIAVALGCAMRYSSRIGYAAAYNLNESNLFSPIGINCHLCPRLACSQRAHQRLFDDLPLDPSRRGNTRYES